MNFHPHISKLSLRHVINNNPFNYLVTFLIIINITLIAINIGIWFLAAHQNLFIAADFTNFYTGFKMILQGDGRNLYNLELQAQYQQVIMNNTMFTGGLLPYNTLPFVAVLFSPMALLPINLSFYVWMVVEFGLLVWTIYLANRIFSNWTKYERLIMNIMILAFWPMALTFLHGQFSLLLLVCILQFYNSVKSEKYGQAGIWLSLLLVKPQLFLIPASTIVNKSYWLIAISTILSAIVLFIFSSFFVGFNTWMNYFKIIPGLFGYFGKFGFDPTIQYTLRGLLTISMGSTQANKINLISVGSLVAGIVFIWLLWMKGINANNPKFKLYLAFTLLLSVFLSLHLYAYDDLIIIVTGLLFYDYLRENNYPRKVCTVFIMLSPLVFIVADFSRVILFNIFLLPVLLMLFFLFWMMYYIIADRNKVNNYSLQHN